MIQLDMPWKTTHGEAISASIGDILLRAVNSRIDKDPRFWARLTRKQKRAAPMRKPSGKEIRDYITTTDEITGYS